MAVATAERYITEDEYLELEEKSEFRHEYHDGRIYAMAGATARHELITGNVIRELGNRVGSGPCAVYGSNLRIRVDATGLNTYPDAMVVCGELHLAGREPQACTNPSIIVEVLSRSTFGYDRGEKWFHYKQIES